MDFLVGMEAIGSLPSQKGIKGSVAENGIGMGMWMTTTLLALEVVIGSLEGGLDLQPAGAFLGTWRRRVCGWTREEGKGKGRAQ